MGLADEEGVSSVIVALLSISVVTGNFGPFGIELQATNFASIRWWMRQLGFTNY